MPNEEKNNTTEKREKLIFKIIFKAALIRSALEISESIKGKSTRELLDGLKFENGEVYCIHYKFFYINFERNLYEISDSIHHKIASLSDELIEMNYSIIEKQILGTIFEIEDNVRTLIYPDLLEGVEDEEFGLLFGAFITSAKIRSPILSLLNVNESRRIVAKQIAQFFGTAIGTTAFILLFLPIAVWGLEHLNMTEVAKGYINSQSQINFWNFIKSYFNLSYNYFSAMSLKDYLLYSSAVICLHIALTYLIIRFIAGFLVWRLFRKKINARDVISQHVLPHICIENHNDIDAQITQLKEFYGLMARTIKSKEILDISKIYLAHENWSEIRMVLFLKRSIGRKSYQRILNELYEGIMQIRGKKTLT